MVGDCGVQKHHCCRIRFVSGVVILDCFYEEMECFSIGMWERPVFAIVHERRDLRTPGSCTYRYTCTGFVAAFPRPHSVPTVIISQYGTKLSISPTSRWLLLGIRVARAFVGFALQMSCLRFAFGHCGTDQLTAA